MQTVQQSGVAHTFFRGPTHNHDTLLILFQDPAFLLPTKLFFHHYFKIMEKPLKTSLWAHLLFMNWKCVSKQTEVIFSTPSAAFYPTGTWTKQAADTGKGQKHWPGGLWMLKAFSKGKAGNQPLHRNECRSKKNGCIKLPSKSLNNSRMLQYKMGFVHWW